jgi:hypothetical protein
MIRDGVAVTLADALALLEPLIERLHAGSVRQSTSQAITAIKSALAERVRP